MPAKTNKKTTTKVVVKKDISKKTISKKTAKPDAKMPPKAKKVEEPIDIEAEVVALRKEINDLKKKNKGYTLYFNALPKPPKKPQKTQPGQIFKADMIKKKANIERLEQYKEQYKEKYAVFLKAYKKSYKFDKKPINSKEEHMKKRNYHFIKGGEEPSMFAFSNYLAKDVYPTLSKKEQKKYISDSTKAQEKKLEAFDTAKEVWLEKVSHAGILYEHCQFMEGMLVSSDFAVKLIKHREGLEKKISGNEEKPKKNATTKDKKAKTTVKDKKTKAKAKTIKLKTAKK